MTASDDATTAFALEIKVLRVREYGIAAHLLYLEAHLASQLAGQLIQHHLALVIGDARGSELVAPVVLGIVLDDQLLDEPKHRADGVTMHRLTRCIVCVHV